MLRLILLAVFLGSVYGFGPGTRQVVSASRADLSMKIFDWKAREEFVDFTIPDGKWFHSRMKEGVTVDCAMMITLQHIEM
jgi:hypothetical protein